MVITKLKPPFWSSKKDIPIGLDWTRHMVCMWQEDDALRFDSSAEHIEDAVVRLCGSMYDCAEAFKEGPRGELIRVGRLDFINKILGSRIDMVDKGDHDLKLYKNGWVICHSFDGTSLYRVMLESLDD